MTSQHLNVLVVGATGAVGCAAAIEAHRRGAHVWLAMRDTSKEIKGIKNEDGTPDSYHRVQADLSQPDTLKFAVQQSGATSAFVYTMDQSTDYMQSTFEVLKDAGIEYVVLLSSHSVTGAAEQETNMRDFIQQVHAKTEVALKKSGIPYTAVRPMYFTSNILWYREELRQGTVKLLYPDMRFDYIAPTDIGTVCGALLAEPRFRTPNQTINLCGPELLTQRTAMGIIGQSLGRKIKVEEIDEAAWYEKLKHMPRPVVDSITNGMRAVNAGHNMYPKEEYEEAVANISKYAEREPTTLVEWIEANRTSFE